MKDLEVDIGNFLKKGHAHSDSATSTNGTTLEPESLEDFLEEVKKDSKDEEEIHTFIKESYLDSGFSISWKPFKTQIIRNKHLDQEYEEKKQDYLIRGRRGKELTESIGFLIENNVSNLETMCAVGPQAKESEYNPLGYNQMGVYLCVHPDVCMQHALVKNAGTQVLRLLVCKYMSGRSTTAIPRFASASEFIKPTQGYDSHKSALPPSVGESLQTQFDRSQVYLYEINKLLQPSSRPRHVLPYAVVTYTVEGAYNPVVDAKPIPIKDRLAENPRLQQIVKAINQKKKSNSSPCETESTNTQQTPPYVIPTLPAQQDARFLAPCAPMTNGQAGLETNGINEENAELIERSVESCLSNGCVSDDELDSSDLDMNPQLRKVISQINARFIPDVVRSSPSINGVAPKHPSTSQVEGSLVQGDHLGMLSRSSSTDSLHSSLSNDALNSNAVGNATWHLRSGIMGMPNRLDTNPQSNKDNIPVGIIPQSPYSLSPSSQRSFSPSIPASLKPPQLYQHPPAMMTNLTPRHVYNGYPGALKQSPITASNMAHLDFLHRNAHPQQTLYNTSPMVSMVRSAMPNGSIPGAVQILPNPSMNLYDRFASMQSMQSMQSSLAFSRPPAVNTMNTVPAMSLAPGVLGAHGAVQGSVAQMPHTIGHPLKRTFTDAYGQFGFDKKPKYF